MAAQCCGLDDDKKHKLHARHLTGRPFPQNESLQVDAPDRQHEAGNHSARFDHLHKDLLKDATDKLATQQQVVGKPSHLHLDSQAADSTPLSAGGISARSRPLSARGISAHGRSPSSRCKITSISMHAINERLAKQLYAAHEVAAPPRAGGTLFAASASSSLLDWSGPNVDVQSSQEGSANIGKVVDKLMSERMMDRHLLSKVARRLDILEASVESLSHSVQSVEQKEPQAKGADVSELNNLFAQTGTGIAEEAEPNMPDVNLKRSSMQLAISNWNAISKLRDLCQAYDSRITELEDFCENCDNRLSDLESLVETIEDAPLASGDTGTGWDGFCEGLAAHKSSLNRNQALTADNSTRDTIARARPETDVLAQTAEQRVDQPFDIDSGVVLVAENKLTRHCSRKLHQKASDEASRDSLHAQELYHFAENVWDASLFIGVPQIGLGGSLFMFFLVLVNSAMQLIYMLVVYEYFTGSNFDEETVRDYVRFRLDIAHNLKHLDHDSTSLASRLCGNDHALEMANQQMSALRLINDYLPNEEYAAFREVGVFGPFAGPLMCVISIVVWVLVVVEEIRSIGALVAGLIHMHRRAYTMHQRADTPHHTKWQLVDGLWDIQGMSGIRYTIAGFVCALRLAIILMLGAAGVQYLIHTTALQDLVINSVALACILNIDESLFEAMAPYPVRHFLTSLKPIPSPALSRWGGIDAKAGLALVTTVGTAIAAIPMYLVPEMRNLEGARDALCGGNINFVSSEGNYPPHMFWADSAPLNSLHMKHAVAYNKRLVGSFIDDKANVQVTKLSSIRGGSWSLEEISELTISEAAGAFNPNCLNLPFDGTEQALLDMYGERLEEVSDKRLKEFCEQSLVDLCYAPTQGGTIIRTMCPVLCGCDDPASYQPFLEPETGCPPSCRNTAKYQAALKARPCQDSPSLEVRDGWERYAHRIAEIPIEGKWPIQVQSEFQALNKWMLSAGCDAISKYKEAYESDELCIEGRGKGLPVKSFRLWCPIACNCPNRSYGDRHNCPRACYR